jgi:hypothetical protein
MHSYSCFSCRFAELHINNITYFVASLYFIYRRSENNRLHGAEWLNDDELYWIGKCVGGGHRDLMYFPGICMKGVKQTMKPISKDNVSAEIRTGNLSVVATRASFPVML